MHRPTSRPVFPLISLALLVVVSPPARGDDGCDVEAPRVVAIGDVHGAYDNFVAALQLAGVVDEEAKWAGGATHLVQTGDLLDRGKDTRQVLDLLMRLEKEAKEAGGRVHALLGNHEVMNLLGDLRYVNPEEYEAFRTRDSFRRVQRLWQSAVDRARARARKAGEDFDEDALRKRLEKEAPLGFVERTRAFSSEGEYGQWLRKRNAVARVNGVVFLHGGLTPEVADLGCKEINKRVRREITRDFDKTRKEPMKALSTRGDGPLWYRGLAEDDEATLEPSLEKTLDAMDARAVVVGHTVCENGRIRPRLAARVIMIDVGLSPAYNGSLAALEVLEDGSMSALYEGSRVLLSTPETEAPAEHLPARTGTR